jgi:hypothetical protein
MSQHLNKTALCYVIMNFSQALRGTYDKAIKPAVSDAEKETGLKIRCLRADDIAFPGSIKREIIDSIYEANAVIADLTGNNPNVFYELGISHSVGNQTIMISQSIAKIPFDIKAYRVIEYKPSPDGLVQLQSELCKAVTEVLTGLGKPSNPVQDFAPIRFPSVVVSFAELVAFESQNARSVWIIEPALDADERFFRDVIKHNIENRAVQYRILVPNTKTVLKSVRRFRDALDVSDAAWQRIAIRTLEPHNVESEVTIYDAHSREQRVLIMSPSPLENKQLFWFPIRDTRANVILERYVTLWDEVSKPLADAISI